MGTLLHFLKIFGSKRILLYNGEHFLSFHYEKNYCIRNGVGRRFFAGADGNIDWHVVDDEFNHHAIDLLNTVDTILFGRVTYQMFENYWPEALKDQKTSKDDLVISRRIEDANEIVFSKILEKVGWKNVKLLKDIIPEEIKKLKQQPGKDIVVYGSGTIVQALTRAGLVDGYGYRLFVAPVVLGSGKPLLKDIKDRMKLKLLQAKAFGSGVVVLCYQPL